MPKLADAPPVSVTPTILRDDYERLSWIVTSGTRFRRIPSSSRLLAEELRRATVVRTHEPDSVVTMHSAVEFQAEDSNRVRRAVLVYPGEEHEDTGRLSVLSPVGAALIGMPAGQSTRWRTATGEWRALHVLRVTSRPNGGTGR